MPVRISQIEKRRSVRICKISLFRFQEASFVNFMLPVVIHARHGAGQAVQRIRLVRAFHREIPGTALRQRIPHNKILSAVPESRNFVRGPALPMCENKVKFHIVKRILIRSCALKSKLGRHPDLSPVIADKRAELRRFSRHLKRSFIPAEKSERHKKNNKEKKQRQSAFCRDRQIHKRIDLLKNFYYI